MYIHLHTSKSKANQFLMDVIFQPFPIRKDLESSNWNNKLSMDSWIYHDS